MDRRGGVDEVEWIVERFGGNAGLEPWTGRRGDVWSIKSESIPYVSPTVPKTGV